MSSFLNGSSSFRIKISKGKNENYFLLENSVNHKEITWIQDPDPFFPVRIQDPDPDPHPHQNQMDSKHCITEMLRFVNLKSDFLKFHYLLWFLRTSLVTTFVIIQINGVNFVPFI